MATDQLPVITQIKLSPSRGREDAARNGQVLTEKRTREAVSFMKRVQLGSLDRQPRPGDVYRSNHNTAGFTAKQPRPLGLLPDRGRLDLLDELARILPPIPVYPQYQPPRPRHSTQPEVLVTHESGSQSTDTSAAARHSVNVESHHVEGSSTYRLSEQLTQRDALKQEMTQLVQDDPDYMQTLAQLNIRDYYTPHAAQKQQPNGILRRRRTNTLPPVSKPKVFALTNNKRAQDNQLHRSVGVAQYMTFTERAQLCDRHLSLDQRHATDSGPCERCRLRGGRCAQCKALRTGGGYIILDGGQLSEDEMKRRFGRRFGGSQFSRDDLSHSRQGRPSSSHHGAAGDGLTGHRGDDNQGSGWGGANDGRHGNTGNWAGLGDGDDGRDGRGDNGSGRHTSDTGGAGMMGDGIGGRGRSRGHDTGGRVQYDGRGGNDTTGGDGAGGVLGGRGRSGADGRDKMIDDSGRQSSMSGRPTSRMSGSRPGSTLGTRPPSSMRRGGRGTGGRRRTTDIEKRSGGAGREREEGSEDSGSESDDEKRRRRRLKKVKGEDGDDGGSSGDEDNERSKFKYKRQANDDDDTTSHSYGNLMKFKRKRDDVKALHATLKELQGIDPLDYLAKYCIIDQSKLPHYRHAYDNVDRDEDDEIDVAELDFALKAVNYDLISDAEMNYVHSVLELAGRYRLNFRLFSLIAALSEKVVSLEDMVKRLINKMDFEALEVKMKKCKELFYLLADSECPVGHEGGVVTSSSLAVELQAGGLTEEHVEFVVERLNHEGKGIVEFLDYLTYVPLFVEIHDAIYGNPLDFSRTK